MMDDAYRFLEALAPQGAITFQTFLDQKDGQAHPKILHGTIKQHSNALLALNKTGSGIYIMVNEGDGKGRSKGNVVRVRALFADFDGAPLPETWVLEPSIIVESSQGKYHTYWLLADTLPLDDFKPLQKAIAEVFGSDNKVCDLPRVMRLPAFYHQKSEPFLTRLIKCDGKLRYTTNQLKEVFPIREVEAHKPPPMTFSTDYSTDNARQYAQKALENEYDFVSSAGEGNRNHALNKAAFSLGQLVGGGLLDRSEVENSLMNAGLSCGLSKTEINITISSGLRAGLKEPRYPDLSQDSGRSRGKLTSDRNNNKQIFVPYRIKRKLRRKQRLDRLKGYG